MEDAERDTYPDIEKAKALGDHSADVIRVAKGGDIGYARRELENFEDPVLRLKILVAMFEGGGGPQYLTSAKEELTKITDKSWKGKCERLINEAHPPESKSR